MPCGVYFNPSARIVSAKPGASRSITERVASGVTSLGVSPVPPVVKIRSQPPSMKWCSRSSISAKSSGTTSIPTTSQPASSAAAASLGPDRSSASRAATRVETVRIAARMAGRLERGGLVRALRALDQLAHRGLVAAAEQLDRVRIAVDDALEERLTVLVGRQRALRPPAHLVEQDGQARVRLPVGLGDLRLHALGQRGGGPGGGDRDGQRAAADDRGQDEV